MHSQSARNMRDMEEPNFMAAVYTGRCGKRKQLRVYVFTIIKTHPQSPFLKSCCSILLDTSDLEGAYYRGTLKE